MARSSSELVDCQAGVIAMVLVLCVSDLLQNPLLVPVKQLRGSARVDGLGKVWLSAFCWEGSF